MPICTRQSHDVWSHLHWLGLQTPTEDVIVVLEETFGGEEGIDISSFLPCRSFSFLYLISDNVFIVTTDRPTLVECIRFQGLERMIDIAEEISTKYHDFGLLLLNDHYGTRVRNIELKHREDAKRINKEILQEWAIGSGKKPVSWQTLTEVLCDIGLCTLASEIKAVKSESAIS